MSLVNISIDDVSPHPKSSIKVLDRCFELIEVFPDIKFTLFIPLSYQRMGGRNYPLTGDDGFCDSLRSLPKKHFELGWHGYSHGIPAVSNNDEFKDLNNEEAAAALSNMFEEADLADIKDHFKPIFRPSAFRMSPETFDACRGMGCEILALSDDPVINAAYGGKDKTWKKVVYYNVNPPFKPLRLFDKTEIVYHACEWDRSYLSNEFTDDLVRFLNKNRCEFEFVFMEDMV